MPAGTGRSRTSDLRRLTLLCPWLLLALAVSGPCCGDHGSDGGARGDAACAGAETSAIDLDTGTGTLFGTLALPGGCGPFPVALIHAGSGPTDRDGNGPSARNDSLKLLAEALAARGIASVRTDKRGIGASAAAGPASEHDLRFETLVEDAAAWATRLGKDARFSSVSIIGHSEGSLIGMLAAAKGPVRAFVSIAGAGRPAGVLLRAQLAPRTPPDLLAVANHIIDELEFGREVANVPQLLSPLFRPSVQPYLIGWLRYDPAREISDLNLPALVVQGTADLQVTEEDARLLDADRPETEVVLVPGMNHVLKDVSGTLAEQLPSYNDPSLPIDPAVPDAIAAFLTKILR
jgi:pimeloyl-ACP methyl ester carboxylesterase